MGKLKEWARLAFSRATPVRVLSEMTLEEVAQRVLLDSIPVERILLAGGMHGRGSEQRLLNLLEGLHGKSKVIAANIDEASKPDLIADLASPWPFQESSFDLVLSTWVLEHIESPQTFFREAYRVLKPGGFLFIAVPFIHRKHGSPFDYWRYTDTALLSLTRNCGFRRTEISQVSGGAIYSLSELIMAIRGRACNRFALIFLGPNIRLCSCVGKPDNR